MKNFDFITKCPQLKDLSTYCEEAESFALSHPRLSAVSARNALEFLIKYTYKAKCGDIPARASLFELISSYEIENFINDQCILDSLHYIRILGNNAAHNNKIKPTEALLGLENLHFFVGEMLILLGLINDYPAFDRSLIDKAATPKNVETEKIEVKSETEKIFADAIGKDTSFNAQRPEYMSEAKTRKIYIDSYLREAGWEVCDKENGSIAGKAGVEIKV